MHTYTPTAMLDVHQDLGAAGRAHIEAILKKQEGVTDAAFSPHVNRVVFVHYDNTRTDARAVRNRVQEVLETDGPATCLIGM